MFYSRALSVASFEIAAAAAVSGAAFAFLPAPAPPTLPVFPPSLAVLVAFPASLVVLLAFVLAVFFATGGGMAVAQNIAREGAVGPLVELLGGACGEGAQEESAGALYALAEDKGNRLEITHADGTPQLSRQLPIGPYLGT